MAFTIQESLGWFEQPPLELICAGSLLLLFELGVTEIKLFPSENLARSHDFPPCCWFYALSHIHYVLTVFTLQKSRVWYIRRQNDSAPGSTLLIRTLSDVRGACEWQSSATDFSLRFTDCLMSSAHLWVRVFPSEFQNEFPFTLPFFS